jgi:hypothetical protein
MENLPVVKAFAVKTLSIIAILRKKIDKFLENFLKIFAELRIVFQTFFF